MRQIIYAGLMAMLCATLAMAQPVKPAVQNGVTFVSGGIGSASQEQLKAYEKEFNLKLVFTLVEGNFLADVGVTIKNAAGKTLVEHLADGPYFLAKLPAGKYSVSAVYEGKVLTRQVSARDGRLHTEHLRWPGNPGTDFALPPASMREDGKK